MPLHQIIVQSNHAAYESGVAYANNLSDEISSLIVLGFDNKEKLQKAYDELCQTSGKRFVQFFEPDWDYGFTAFCSEPVSLEERKIFKKYKLFKGGK